MSGEPSLFDATPAPRVVDAAPLGDPREIVATESGAEVTCELGTLTLSVAQFFWLRRTLGKVAP